VPLLDMNGWKADDYARYDAFFDAPAIIVPPETLDAALDEARADQKIAVEIPNTFVPGVLRQVQDRLSLIVVGFPKFSDGRGFSIGRMLREQGFTGTLRASGFLVPDEFAFARACGFEEVEMSDEHAARQPLEQWQKAASAFTVGYHPGPAVGASIFARRRAARNAA
jgi:uncharacterized protein (DUF934 family)